MRIRLVWICLLFAGVLRAAAFSVMTYNCKGNGAADWSANAGQVQAIGHQIMYLQPDIITFNEIPENYVWQMTNWVTSYLPGYFLATNSVGDGYIRSVIASRYPITRSTSYLHGSSLSAYGSSSTFTRDLFEAQINVPTLSLPVHVFMTHLKSTGSSTAQADATRRAAEAGAISNFFVSVFLPGTNGSHPYTLSGDLNEDIVRPGTNYTSGQPIQRLTSPPTSLRLATPVNPYTGDDRTISIQAGLSARFDYILPCASLFSNIASSQVFRTDLLPSPPWPLLANDDRTASDHLPVVMVFNGNVIPPSIASRPQDQVVAAGQTAMFTVGVSGTPPFSYQWLLNGRGITGATSSACTRSNAQPADAGSYSVVVSNKAGTVTSSSALLTLITPPVITGGPQSQAVSVGQSVSFAVTVAGSRPMSCQWRFNGNPLPGATASSWLVVGARGVNAGSYSVVASNSLGAVVSSNATLGVIQNAAFGDNSLGQGIALAGPANLIAVAAGAWHNLGLGADGSVVAWGDGFSGQCDVPVSLTNALAITAGGYHNLALRADGSVAAWGANDYGQINVPAQLGQVIGLAAGTWHSVALQADATVKVWGDNSFWQTNQPGGLTNTTAVAAGGNHTLALKSDGTVVAWGENSDAEGNVAGQSVVPSGLSNVVAIAAGKYHSLAVTGDGAVVAWGDNSQGQCDVPPGLSNVVAVAAGGKHSVALKSDGTVRAWGADWNGQCDVPPGLVPASGIAAGEDHTALMLADSIPVPQLLNPAWMRGGFSALIQTLNGRNYALEFRNSLGATNWIALSTNGGNGALRVLADPAATDVQRFYRMRQW